MIEHLFCVLIFLFGLQVFARKLTDIHNHATLKMVTEFQVQFPNKCVICSYYRWGVNHGFNPSKPKEHNCIEIKGDK